MDNKTLYGLVSEYAAKTEARRKLDAESKRLATEIALLDERLVQEFETAGIQNVKTASGQTVYLNREIFAKHYGLTSGTWTSKSPRACNPSSTLQRFIE